VTLSRSDPSRARPRAGLADLARSHGPEFLRYFIVSVGGLALDFAILIALTEGAGFHYLVSNAIAFTVGTTVGYAVCVAWVFETRRLSSRHWEYTAFLVIGVAGLALNEAALWALVEGGGLHYVAAKVGASGASFGFNYLARKRLLFS
jgi:putative flippase GtrA